MVVVGSTFAKHSAAASIVLVLVCCHLQASLGFPFFVLLVFWG